MNYQARRAFNIKLKHQAVYTVLDSCMLLGKNVYNASLFLILNLHGAYIYDKENKMMQVKKDLHKHQKETIDLYKQAIADLNHYQFNKYKNKIKDKSPEEIDKIKKPIPLPLLKNSIDSKEFNQLLLQANLLERVLKLKEKNSPFKDYGKVYSSIAQAALMQAIQDCKSWLQTMIQFYMGNKSSDNASLLQRPRYKDKNERLTIELSSKLFSKTGTLFKVNLEKHTLFTDFHDPVKTKLPESVINEFNKLNLKKLIDEQLNKRIDKTTTQYSIQTIRFVPHRKTGKGLHEHNLKIEVVVKLEQDLPEKSILSKALKFHEANRKEYKTKEKDTFWDLKKKKQDKILTDFRKVYSSDIQRISAIDLGIVNTATVIHNQAELHQIYAGKRINKISIINKDLLIKIKFNQALKEDKNIAVEEKIKQKISNLLIKVENLKNNHLHQLSNHIIDKCLKYETQFC